MRRFQAILCVAGLVGFVLGAPPALAKDRSAPVEACTHNSWGFLTFNDHRFGTVNMCSYAVTVWFMRPTGDLLHADVLPGGTFDSGLTSAQFNDDTWVFATCRAGLAPSPAVDKEHWDQILNTQYTCVRP